MATILGTYGLVGFQSLAYKLTMSSTADVQPISDLLTTSGLAALPYPSPTMPSSLKAFLSATYTSATAMADAFRAKGGRIEFRQVGGTAAPALPVVEWVNANPVVSLGWTIAGGASNEVFEVNITLPFSMVQ